MKKGIRYLLTILGILILSIGAVITYIKMAMPNVGPPPELTIEITEERVAHGKYLANHVMLCMDCHAERDFSLFAGPPFPETLGAGGEEFNREMGLPGRFIARNITPAALGDWTDGEIFRAIVSGVSRDGSALFPVMPYPHYSTLDEEDIYSVIAYLRTLDPVQSNLPPREVDFPVNIIINTMPVKPNLAPKPSRENLVDYGKYLITSAACTDCHTRQENGQFVGEPYAGGNEYHLPDGAVLRSANLTPHPTGIGNWSKEQFVARFKAYSHENGYEHKPVRPGQFQTIMPWPMYTDMKTDDLEAIYTYLMSLPPVDNRIELFTPASN